MTSLMITPETIVPPGSTVTLQDQTWEDYENLLGLREDIRQDKAGIRIRYSAITQELKLISPLAGQSNRSDTLADLVKILLKFSNRDWDGFKPITLKQVGQGGIEPDACFYIQSQGAILGKERIDLAIDPPPDLAIEVDLSSRTDIADYLPFIPEGEQRSLAIPEVWIYRKNELLIYRLENQDYCNSETSGIFPDFDVKTKLPQYVERAWSLGSSIALREFEQSLA